MEKFKIVCKKCGSENVKMTLGVAGYDEEGDYYAAVEIKCKDCKNQEELEQTWDEDKEES